MRPDEHPELKAAGPSEATCDRCIMEFFPNQRDDVCKDCSLNPLTSNKAKRSFLEAATNREDRMTFDQLQERQAKLVPS